MKRFAIVLCALLAAALACSLPGLGGKGNDPGEGGPTGDGPATGGETWAAEVGARGAYEDVMSRFPAPADAAWTFLPYPALQLPTAGGYYLDTPDCDAVLRDSAKALEAEGYSVETAELGLSFIARRADGGFSVMARPVGTGCRLDLWPLASVSISGILAGSGWADVACADWQYTETVRGEPGKSLDADIAPGAEASGFVAFEVPENAEGFSLIFYADPFGNDETPVSLEPVGASVAIDGLTLTADGVSFPAASESFRPAEGHRFLAVSLTLHNDRAETVSVSSLLQFKLRDGSGGEYSASLNAAVAAGQATATQDAEVTRRVFMLSVAGIPGEDGETLLVNVGAQGYTGEDGTFAVTADESLLGRLPVRTRAESILYQGQVSGAMLGGLFALGGEPLPTPDPQTQAEMEQRFQAFDSLLSGEGRLIVQDGGRRGTFELTLTKRPSFFSADGDESDEPETVGTVSGSWTCPAVVSGQ